MAKRKRSTAKTIPRLAAKPRAALYSEPYNWVNPSRKATDEEIEQMLDECENSPTLSAEEARQYLSERIATWKEQRK